MKIYKAEYSHIGGRNINEDSFCCEIGNGQCAYAVVADGLGGHGDGGIASKIAVRYLSQCRNCTVMPTDAQITEWFRDANEEIISRNQSVAGMRTTAVFWALFHGYAVWAHVGDSRLYHFHNGQLLNVTNDHSVPQMQVYAGELTREQITDSPDRNRLLRAIGSEQMEVEIHPAVQLQQGRNAFLLCSDGFWEYLTDSEIWLDLQKSASPSEWLMYLRCRGEMRRNDKADNHTAIAIFADV